MILKGDWEAGCQEAAVMLKITEEIFFLPWLGDAQLNVLRELGTLSEPRVPFRLIVGF